MKRMLNSNWGRAIVGVLALTLAGTGLFCLVPKGQALTNISTDRFTRQVRFEKQANFVGGWKVGVTGYLVDNAGNATLKAVTGTTALFSGATLGKANVIDYITTTAARAITAAESGTTFIMSSTSDDPCTFTLPTAAAGLWYKFVDMDATAAADMCIKPSAADAISTLTAVKSFNSTTDVVGSTLVLEAVDATNWVIISRENVWAGGTP